MGSNTLITESMVEQIGDHPIVRETDSKVGISQPTIRGHWRMYVEMSNGPTKLYRVRAYTVGGKEDTVSNLDGKWAVSREEAVERWNSYWEEYWNKSWKE